jgi:transglutaminase-like putative cysteine protease
MTSHFFGCRARFLLLIALIATLPLPRAWAADAAYRFAPAGNWVLPATPEYSAPEPAGETSDGTWLIALDRQINVTANGNDAYQYLAVRVSIAAGVERESQIDLEVDPSYQTIDIHFLRVRRGDTSIDARQDARITVLPQETQLRERIYNGGYNVNILLADVRPGDVVEYAYTTHSRETLFPGHYATSFVVGWSDPVHWHRVRIRAPLGRPMRARLSNSSTAPEFTVRGTARELVLEGHDLAGIPAEDNRPTWYSPWPRLYVSDFKDWAEVARVVDPLYSAATRATPSVVTVAREISATGGSPEQLALKALQYVQEQVSYVSISIGHGGYQPAAPDTVLQRRYGDCKDKSVLLVALLAQLKISAQPALVHTRRGRILPDMLPTPFAFDHAMVRMQIGANTFWVDGTAVKRYAPLSVDGPPDFENALLVGSASERLVAIPRPSPESRLKETFVTVDVRAGAGKPGKLTVLTRYHGSSADTMRAAIARSSLEQRRADYLDYATHYYASAKSAGPLQINDDTARDILDVREIYTLSSPFKTEKSKYALTLHADELYDYSRTISSSERRAPLALDYPVFVRQHITALMPGTWPVHAEKVRVDNPAFRYESDVAYSGSKVELRYEYEALKEEVAPAALPKYLADRKAFDDDVGYTLRQDRTIKQQFIITPKRRPDRWVTFVFLVVTGVALWRLRPLAHWNPAPHVPQIGAPRGIRGWLILPAIGTALGPLMTIDLFMYKVASMPIGNGWTAPVQVALAATTATLFVAQAYLVSLFFRRRTSAPKLYIATAWLAVVCSAAVNAWIVSTQNMGANAAAIFGYRPGRSWIELALALFVTLYLWRSQRVRATFQEVVQLKPLSS